MKQPHLTLSLWRLGVGFGAITLFVGIASHNSGHGLADTNHIPTGSFTKVSCAYEASRKDWLYTISAKWSDADAGSNDANAYLGNKNTKPNNPDNSIDGKNYDGPTHTWAIYRSSLTDGLWPIQLFVHDVGNPLVGVWKVEATANRPSCPNPPVVPPPATPPAGGGSTGGGGSSSGGSKPTGGSSTTHSSSTPVSTVAVPSSAADGTVSLGTTSAVITVPTDGASTVHLAYAIAGAPNQNTDDQPVSGDSTDVQLLDLDASTSYTYQIVRTNSAGVIVTAGNQQFTTNGYTVQMHFVDSSKQPVAGITGSINDANNTQATSGSGGNLIFTNLPDGQYTVNYVYNGNNYSQNFDTTNNTSDQIDDAGVPVTITLSDAVNVDKLVVGKSADQAAGKKHSALPVILVIVFLAALIGAAVWFILRRRGQAAADYPTYTPPAASPVPLPQAATLSSTPQVTPAPSATAVKPSKHDTTAQPLPAHAGESLRDMVLESMRAQNAQPAASQPSPALPTALNALPIVPSVPASVQPLPQPTVSPIAASPVQAQPPVTLPAQPLPNQDDGQTIQISHDRPS